MLFVWLVVLLFVLFAFLVFVCLSLGGLPHTWPGTLLYFRRGLNTWYLLQFDLLTAAIVAMSAAMVEKKLES